jgi:putative hemolysin
MPAKRKPDMHLRFLPSLLPNRRKTEKLQREISPLQELLQRDLAALRVGDLTVRLAENNEDIEAAQALRYRIFYEEMHAQPTLQMRQLERDFDDLDPVCDHLLVYDNNREVVVGTYRLITRAMAVKRGGFYTSGEYDISCLETYPGGVLELGRSCVDAEYRNGTTMQLLWRAIAIYVTAHGVELMFGCASLPGVDVEALRLGLSYLHHHHLAPEATRPIALPGRRVALEMLPQESIDQKLALLSLPPLVKGYLRIGARIGDGAVVDWQFNTTDVCIIVQTEYVADKYMKRFDIPGGSDA